VQSGREGQLAGARVLLTRQVEDSVDLAERIRNQGGEVTSLPLVRIAPPDDPEPLRRARDGIVSFDWVILTSRHAVQALLHGLDVPKAKRPKIAAVGESTAEMIRREGWPLDLVSSGRGGVALAEEIMERESLAGLSMLYPCSSLAGDEMARRLEAAGAGVTSVTAYRTLPPDASDAAVKRISREVREGRIDIAVFASPSAVRHLRELVSGEEALQRLTAVSIGKTTAAAAKAQGLTRIVEAPQPDTHGLFQAVTLAWSELVKERTGS
jgi:uroporphyrinogen-III synthase